MRGRRSDARRPLLVTTLCLAGASLLAAQTASGAGQFGRWATTPAPHAAAGLAQQGSYIARRLVWYSDRYWARVAGGDTDLPPHVNGHDEFAAHWAQEMLHDLRGLQAGVYRQSFPTPGFRGSPAARDGVNVIVAVPGSQHPDRSIIVGAHYDGERTSKGSAYDDTSGCMILLGVARALGALWRARGLPALTVEFVLFDAEEQGLIGSEAYAFDQRQGALLPVPVLMINEEQSGVAYPVRPFGLLSRASLPSVALTPSTVPADAARVWGIKQIAPKDPQLQSALVRRLHSARAAAFRQLHAVYPLLHYRGGDAPVFTSHDTSKLQLLAPPSVDSDNLAFDALGLPTATFIGDVGFYRHQSDWAFPFDQPQDTAQLLACDTGGSPHPGAALAAALALPATLTGLLIQDYAPPAPGTGVAIFSSIPGAGRPTGFTAVGGTSISWDFGDGAQAMGGTVAHTYDAAGPYQLTVHSGAGSQSWKVVVPPQAPIFKTELPTLLTGPQIMPWNPPELRHVRGCH